MAEILLAVGGAIGLSGLGGAWINRRARRAFIIDTRTAWMRAGQRVRFGPVGVFSFGPLPQRRYAHGVFGALGIVNGALVLDGHRSRRADLRLPLDRLRRIDLGTVPVRTGRAISRKRALSLHYEEQDGWRVATLLADDLQEIASTLQETCDLPVHDAGPTRADSGPAPCTRMIEDIYGEWFAARAGTLYLAPDRLLFDWRETILLDTIQRLDVLAQGTWRDRLPHPARLLRIEHSIPEGLAVSGFVVHRAPAWANAIQRRIDEPIPVQSGRKKKTL